ncbi:RICIN domain-containing protein [Streptomyces sp. NPDC050121]|uniref:RICIN domain-containing protein n=1 Tax=Streptomyces sp. NPDC050121 TaxID=3365601 RepID=UPI00379CCA2A
MTQRKGHPSPIRQAPFSRTAAGPPGPATPGGPAPRRGSDGDVSLPADRHRPGRQAALQDHERNSGKVLDINGFSHRRETSPQQYTFAGANNQLWYFQPATGGYLICNVESRQIPGVSGGSTTSGAAIDEWMVTVRPEGEDFPVAPTPAPHTGPRPRSRAGARCSRGAVRRRGPPPTPRQRQAAPGRKDQTAQPCAPGRVLRADVIDAARLLRPVKRRAMPASFPPPSSRLRPRSIVRAMAAL